MDTLAQDDVEVRRRLSEMTRKVTVLRVNEKALTRRHQIMQEIEANLRKVRIHNSIKPFLHFISCFKVIKYLMYQTQQINI